MEEEKILIHIERLINVLAVLSLLLLSMIFFIYQILLHQLPCPLCLLQRVGFLSMAFGFLLNVRFGIRPSHYALVSLSALFSSFVALRQITLTNTPNNNYLATIFSFHVPTWIFVVSTLLTVSTVIMLGFDRQYEEVYSTESYWKKITNSIFAVLALIILANAIAAFLQCGFDPCPNKPIQYKLLSN